MTQNGDPRKNAPAERVNGILKDELLAKSHLNYEGAVRNVSIAISIYNHHGHMAVLTI